ncbi:helix-turn-helix domain-containing protein [Pedobacter sp.]|uniref:helix-turn-helix domain-containing protein n=1 Tax=Pedobacter sp. TaxID=1411316 RepID=UPI00396CB715
MKATTEILFILSAVGSLNGLILAGYLFFVHKNKSIAELFLAVLLLMLSIRIGKSVFLYFNPGLLKIYLQIGLSACFFIGPSLYYFTKASFASFERVPKAWLTVYIILVVLALVGGSIWPYEDFSEAWRKIIIPYVIYGEWAVFAIMSLYIYIKRRREAKPLVKAVVIGNCLIFLAYVLAILNWIPGSYILGSIMYSFILYLSIFIAFYKNKQEKTEEADKYQNKKIAQENAMRIITKLENIVEKDCLYQNSELKLSDLAQRLNIAPHQLSQILNDNLGKSFSNFINEYRINEAAKRILNETHLKIEEIGYEVGFNSKSAFFTAFKKVKHTTPLKYREELLAAQPGSVL